MFCLTFSSCPLHSSPPGSPFTCFDLALRDTPTRHPTAVYLTPASFFLPLFLVLSCHGGGDDCAVQTMIANEGRLRRLRKSAGITERGVDPWARCRGPGGGAAACGRGVELRNCIRRIQLEKFVDQEVAAEVSRTETYGKAMAMKISFSSVQSRPSVCTCRARGGLRNVR